MHTEDQMPAHLEAEIAWLEEELAELKEAVIKHGPRSSEARMEFLDLLGCTVLICQRLGMFQRAGKRACQLWSAKQQLRKRTPLPWLSLRKVINQIVKADPLTTGSTITFEPAERDGAE